MYCIMYKRVNFLYIIKGLCLGTNPFYLVAYQPIDLKVTSIDEEIFARKGEIKRTGFDISL